MLLLPGQGREMVAGLGTPQISCPRASMLSLRPFGSVCFLRDSSRYSYLASKGKKLFGYKVEKKASMKEKKGTVALSKFRNLM